MLYELHPPEKETEKSQKLLSFVKMAERPGGVAIYLKVLHRAMARAPDKQSI